MQEDTGRSKIDGGRAHRTWLTMPLRTAVLRTAVILVASIVAAEIVSTALLKDVKVTPFSPAMYLDMAVMAIIIIPALYLLVFRPLIRLIEERRRVEQGLERRKREIEALYAVTTAGTRQLDLDRLLPEIVDVVMRLFGADGGWALFQAGEPPGKPRVLGAQGIPTSLLTPEIAGVFSDCPSCPDCVRIESAPGGAKLVSECRSLPAGTFEAAGFHQHLNLLLSDRIEGRVVLNLVWRVPREYDESEYSLLSAISGQVGIAVRNAALYQAEQRARKAADTLASVSLAITRSLDLDSVLASFLDHLALLVPYDRAKVMLLEGKSRLQVRATFTPTGASHFARKPFDTFEVGANAAVREVLVSCASVSIGDTHAQPEWGRAARPGFERSWLGVPLLAGGDAIGLYTLVKAEARFFTPEHVQLAEAISAPAAVAIANARLFDEVQSGRQRLQSLSRQLVDLQEAERRRVARELHDEAGQRLASMVIGLRLLEHEAGNPEAVLARIAELKKTADLTQEGLHRLAADLRPASLDHLGLAPALGQMAAAFIGRGGPAIHLEVMGFDGKRLSPDLETALYRIAQEAVTNAVRHSGARQVSLVVERREGQILMVVEDDGRGFDPDSVSHPDKLGLLGIRERASMFGGNLLVESSPGSGTTVVVEIPNGS